MKSQDSRAKSTVLGAVIVLVLAACLSIMYFRQPLMNIAFPPNPTYLAQATLRTSFGDEVTLMIEEAVLVWWSLESHYDTALLEEMLTGYVLELAELYIEEEFPEQSEYTVTRFVEVSQLNIHDYEPAYIRASACMLQERVKVDPSGEVKQIVFRGERCGIYVFLLEEQTWKLAGYFDTNLSASSVRRDWLIMEEERRNLMRELPNSFLIPHGTPEIIVPQ